MKKKLLSRFWQIANVNLSKVKRDKTTLGNIAALGAFLIFALMDFNNKNIMQHISPLAVGFFVNLISAILGFLLALIVGKNTLKPNGYFLHIGRGILGVISISCGFVAFSIAKVSTVYSIMFVYPLISTLMAAVFLKEIPTRLQTSGVVIGFIGVIAVFRPTDLNFDYSYLLALIVAFSLATNGIWLKKFSSTKNHPLSFIFYHGIIISCTLAYPALHNFQNPAWWIYVFLFLSALLYLTASFLVIYAIQNIKLYALGSMQYTQILWGFLIEALFFSVLPNIWVLFGSLLIVLGGIMVSNQNLVLRMLRIKTSVLNKN